MGEEEEELHTESESGSQTKYNEAIPSGSVLAQYLAMSSSSDTNISAYQCSSNEEFIEFPFPAQFGQVQFGDLANVSVYSTSPPAHQTAEDDENEDKRNDDNRGEINDEATSDNDDNKYDDPVHAQAHITVSADQSHFETNLFFL